MTKLLFTWRITRIYAGRFEAESEVANDYFADEESARAHLEAYCQTLQRVSKKDGKRIYSRVVFSDLLQVTSADEVSL